jgi:hypothetical protein
MAMMKLLLAALVGVVLLATSSRLQMVAAADCYPHCDYNHYLGPSNFSYISPGLFGYLVCGPRTICSPHMVYAYSGVPRGRIDIAFPRRQRP